MSENSSHHVYIVFGAAGAIGRNTVLELAKKQFSSATNLTEFIAIDKDGDGLEQLKKDFKSVTSGVDNSSSSSSLLSSENNKGVNNKDVILTCIAMNVLDDKSFTELSVALLDTNHSEIQSVVFAQSDIPVNTNNNDGTTIIDVPVDDAIDAMISLYVDFPSKFLTHSSTLSSKLKNASIVFLCMNLGDQQGKELIFPKQILDEDKCQSMEDLKSILVTETASDHEYFQTNFPMTTNNTTATSTSTSTSTTATIVEPGLSLLLAHRSVNQMIRSIAYAATHLMGYEKVLVLHPGFYFTNSTTQQSLFSLVTKTSKKMTTNSNTTTNTNDDQQQQQGRYSYHYPGITKDHSEMLFHNQKFVDDNGGKSAGELVARSILEPTLYGGKSIYGRYFGSMLSRPGTWAGIVTKIELPIVQSLVRICSFSTTTNKDGVSSLKALEEQFDAKLQSELIGSFEYE